MVVSNIIYKYTVVEKRLNMRDSLYIYNNGQLHRKDNSLQFIDSGGMKRDIPIERVNDIYIMNETTLNTNLLKFLSQNKVTIHFFNYYDFYIGSYYPRESMLSGKLLVNQVQYYTDNEKRLIIAKRIIKGASANIYRNLRYYNGRGKDVSSYMHDIQEYRNNIDKATSVQELMGYEGNIRNRYYDAWPIIIDQNVEFDKRVMHPPNNMMNSLISYVNALIYTKTLSEIYMTQLNPTISYLHQPGERRFSLCLDLSEIFKPIIGDRLIFSLLNRNQITEKSFSDGLNNLHLTQKASKIIVSELESKLKTTIKHKDLGRSVTYQYLIRLEAYKLIKHLLDEKEYEPFEIWW